MIFLFFLTLIMMAVTLIFSVLNYQTAMDKAVTHEIGGDGGQYNILMCILEMILFVMLGLAELQVIEHLTRSGSL